MNTAEIGHFGFVLLTTLGNGLRVMFHHSLILLLAWLLL